MCKQTLALVVLAAVAGCGPTAYKVTPIPISEKLVEATVRKDPGMFLPKIALIDIEGMLINARQSSLLGSGENPTALAVEKLRKAANDDRVKAVVLRINSPGGTVTASEAIRREVAKLRDGVGERAGKPVIAAMMDVGASGAYYIACGASEIVAEPTCVTGSIGVVLLKFNVAGLFDKLGVDTETIKSGPKKDAGSPFRPLTTDERKIFQDIINEFYENFVRVVADSRKALTITGVRKLADGRIYSGRQAEKLALVDRLGSLEDAIGRAKELAETAAAKVVIYHRPTGYRGTIYSTGGKNRSINLINVTVPETFQSQGYFMYLWQP